MTKENIPKSKKMLFFLVKPREEIFVFRLWYVLLFFSIKIGEE
jgi:hypothetical protein